MPVSRIRRNAAYPPRRAYDKTTLVHNSGVTLAGTRASAHRYLVGSKSVLDWLIERCAVSTKSESGIVNDPNDWSREVGNPRHMLDLVARLTTVSVETMIVDELPALTHRA